MNTIIPGLSLILVGSLLSIMTYRKYKLFWEFFNTRLLRKWLGDSLATVTLYILSIVFIITGILLSMGVI
jgi:hypothetical protein